MNRGRRISTCLRPLLLGSLPALWLVACAAASSRPRYPALPPSAAPPASRVAPSGSVRNSASASPAPTAPLELPTPARHISLNPYRSRTGLAACAVLQDGSVSCWGRRGTGLPQRLAGIDSAVVVSLADDLVVVRSDGSARVLRPTDLQSPPEVLPLKGVRAFAQSGLSSCAVVESGRVMCFDAGLRDKKSRAWKTASEVRGLTGAVEIAVGSSNGCALRKDGQVACWSLGRNPVAQAVSKLANMVELHIDHEEACARDASRAVYCFSLLSRKSAPVKVGEADAFSMTTTFAPQYEGGGATSWISLANDTAIVGPFPLSSDTAPAEKPTSLARSGGKAVQLAIHVQGGCELDQQGTVRCWGRNDDGTLGQPYAGSVGELTVVPGLPALRSVGVGDGFSCGLAVNGEVFCWGGAWLYWEDGSHPPAVRRVPGLSNVDRLIVSNAWACAYSSSGEVSCFEGSVMHFEGKALVVQERVAVRVPALDGSRDLVLPTFTSGSAAVIGRSNELLVGLAYPLKNIVLLPVPGIGPVRQIAVTLGIGSVVALENSGRVLSLDVEDRKITKIRHHPRLQGAVALGTGGSALLPGGKLRDIYIREGRFQEYPVLESSPLVSMAGLDNCGLTSSGAFGCAEDEVFRVWFHGMKQVASSWATTCALDEAGVARCRGNNDKGQCGIMVGREKSDEPVVVALR
jgi:hypothetical protein